MSKWTYKVIKADENPYFDASYMMLLCKDCMMTFKWLTDREKPVFKYCPFCGAKKDEVEE